MKAVRKMAIVGVALAALAAPFFVMPEAGAGAAPASAEWQKVVEAAKKEGRVVVGLGGGGGTDVRNLLTEGFQKQYPEIKVDLTIFGGGARLVSRVLTERRAGRYAWDVYTGGTTTAIENLIPAGVLDPVRPALVHPDVADPKKWFAGVHDFSDAAGTHNLVFGGYVKPPFAYNSKLLNKKEIASYLDLLNPKWRGKIALHDPLQSGSGLAAVTFWYGNEALGKDFIRRMLTEQKPMIVKDYRQQLEWVARGDYLFAIGHHQEIFNELKDKGLPLEQLTADDVKEANYVTAAVASVSPMNRGPHPNATKVFINWLLSRETQTAWSKATGFWSRRMDVPQGHLDPAVIPKVEKLSSYQLNYKEEWVKKRAEIQDYLRTILK
jgi:iron(III) transport system substrate-binding protein